MNICLEDTYLIKIEFSEEKKDKKLNLRAFIDTITFLLRSRSDVQSADGNNLLTNYVVSYTAKLAENVELLSQEESLRK